tara:strand:+ start:2003 stop:3118 length:1116 start_codon:yes stop_codon:yes gene_type:complete
MMDHAYFLYHSIGQYPGKAIQMANAMSEFADIWAAADDGQWPKVLTKREEFLSRWRTLIHAPDGSLTSAENVTTALFSVIGGLPPGYLRGKRLLIAADCFPSLHFLLSGLADRMGFVLDTVPMRDGQFWVQDDDMLDAWGPDVGLALLTFVTSTSSHQCDLSRLLQHGKTMGSLVGLDLTQGIGIIPFSLVDHPVDFAVSSSLKWLCGTPGAGIIQMHTNLIEQVTPELRGWFSQENPFSWDLDAFKYAPDARRFDNGTPSVLACLGSVPALKWHATQEGLLAHNRSLTDQIIVAADHAGLTVATPRLHDQRGGSVMIQLPETTDSQTLVQQLREQSIYVDARGQILRLSPGAITTEHHVDKLFDQLISLV